MRHGAGRNKPHAFENEAPGQQRFKQPGSQIATNAKPLNSRCVNDGVKSSVDAGVKTYDSETAFAIPSMTDGKGGPGVEGCYDRPYKKG